MKIGHIVVLALIGFVYMTVRSIMKMDNNPKSVTAPETYGNAVNEDSVLRNF